MDSTEEVSLAVSPSDKRDSFWSRRVNLRLAVAVIGLTSLYIGVFVSLPDRLFADDTYFYLQVAWNLARGMGSTFNTIMPTNGYHPLWMLLCAIVFKGVPSKLAGVRAVAWLISLLDLATLLIVRRLLKLVANDLWVVAFALLIPFSFLSQLGTEGALSCMFLALVMLLGFEVSGAPSIRTAILFNFVAALAVLSRLDNIFIVAFVWLAVWFEQGRSALKGGRRFQIVTLSIYVILWGAYLGWNRIYFHAWQPISGLLKSSGPLDHKLGTNLPHTGLAALAIIVACLPVVAMHRPDRFFRTVEVPFALGVFCHAAYITLRMSSETRWSWYYTSWILLAAVLFARAISVILENRQRLAVPVAATCVLMLAAAWVKYSYYMVYRGPDPRPPVSFNETVYHREGIRNVLAYDQPGSLAFYSDLRIVPLDGLMGNLEFQHDLATKGLAEVMKDEQIDGFIGPPGRIDAGGAKAICDHVYLQTVQFHCVPNGANSWQPVGVDVYARLPSTYSGTLSLDSDKVVWIKKDFVAVWRVTAAAVTRP